MIEQFVYVTTATGDLVYLNLEDISSVEFGPAQNREPKATCKVFTKQGREYETEGWHFQHKLDRYAQDVMMMRDFRDYREPAGA
jgi:hypothetical protein